MEELLAFLVEPILELLLEGVLALVAEVLTESVTTAVQTCSVLREEGSEGCAARPFSAVVVGVGCLIMGTAIGLIWSVDFPQRLMTRTRTIPGVSMLLAPVAVGPRDVLVRKLAPQARRPSQPAGHLPGRRSVRIRSGAGAFPDGWVLTTSSSA